MGETQKKFSVAEAWNERQGTDKVGEAGRVQIMKKLKPVKGFKQGNNKLRIIL